MRKNNRTGKRLRLIPLILGGYGAFLGLGLAAIGLAEMKEGIGIIRLLIGLGICFLEAGFIGVGNVYGYLVYLDLVNGGIVTIHEEGVYDMMGDGVDWASKSEVRKYMESRRLYICKDFNDFLRFACTGDFLDEDEAKFPTQEELEQDYSY